MSTITPTDIQWFLSNPNAGTGFSGIGTPGNSLGKYMSTSQVFSGVPLDDLFQDIPGPQNAAGQIDYQCVFMMNNTPTGNFMHNPYIWLPLALYTSGGAQITIGMDSHGPVPFNQAAQQAVTIAGSTTAPTGVAAYASPSAVFTQGLLIPDVPPLNCIALWIQRVAVNSPPLSPQTFSIQCTFSSNA